MKYLLDTFLLYILFVVTKTINFRGDLTDVVATTEALRVGPQNSDFAAVFLFSKLYKMFSGYFDPENVLLDNEHI